MFLLVLTGDSLGKTPQEGSELALSAMGALTWYLMDCCLEEQLLTRRKFEQYSPLDTIEVAGQGNSKASIPAFISGRHHMVGEARLVCLILMQ